MLSNAGLWADYGLLIKVREWQASEEETFLTATFHVDCVRNWNVLHAKAMQFVNDLAGLDIASWM